MYDILFYKDKNSKSEIKEYLIKLENSSSKDSRINARKINNHIQALSKFGLGAGEPYIKHIEGEIWELRPIRNRIFFASYKDNKFILLHHFLKRTQRTPKREIDQAKRNLDDAKRRNF